jgi:hypothetical protein
VSQSNSFVSLTGVTSRRSAGDVGTVETHRRVVTC